MSTTERSLLQNVGNVLFRNVMLLATSTLLHESAAGHPEPPEYRWRRQQPASYLQQSVASQIKGAFIDSGGVVDRATFDRLNDEIAPILILEGWAYQLLVIITDGVLVWRTWVICPEQQRTRLGLVSAVLGQTLSPTLEFTSLRFYTASLALSLATNLASTLLILYKLWDQLRFTRTLGIKQKSTSPVRKVMLVLVESGFVFCGIQTIYLVLNFAPNAANGSAYAVIGGIIAQVTQTGTGMYPSIVILLVSKQRSIVETFGFSTQLRNHRDPDLEHMPSHLGVSSQPSVSHIPPANIRLGLELPEHLPVGSIAVEDRLDRLEKPWGTAGATQGTINATASAPF
ncbi:hypothetical protein FPV67DRAFT_1444566 [Lyophyllum atratum]|nr:hypothetical protein FPV67DRAFT_1444566 [Lyophyllum atratum]